jgi:putative endonuclease
MARPTVVYVLESINDASHHYVGLTCDVDSRLKVHNAGHCSHSMKHRPWRVLVECRFADAGAALRFERYLKSGSGRAFAETN